MRKAALIVILYTLMMVACGGDKGEDTAASRAAETYYKCLLDSNYNGFVDGLYFSDSIPEGYRNQLVANVKMFLAEQGRAHVGLDSVYALRQQRDSMSTTAEVFLLLTYKDSVQEEIVVPMILVDDVWKMR